MSNMGPFHKKLYALFGWIALSLILVFFGGIAGILLGSIISFICCFWIIFKIPEARDAFQEINELKRMRKNGEELYREGYFTREELEERNRKLDEEIRKI